MKTSMAEELLNLVSEEEYLDVVPTFEGTDYLNRLELAAFKKMISGKLCGLSNFPNPMKPKPKHYRWNVITN